MKKSLFIWYAVSCYYACLYAPNDGTVTRSTDPVTSIKSRELKGYLKLCTFQTAPITDLQKSHNGNLY